MLVLLGSMDEKKGAVFAGFFAVNRDACLLNTIPGIEARMFNRRRLVSIISRRKQVDGIVYVTAEVR